MKIFYTTLILLLTVPVLAQQDRHFTMFNANPIELNPGAAGLFPGAIQAFTNYRSQWTKVLPKFITTFSGSADAKIYEKNNSFVAMGVGFFNDIAGASKLTTNMYNLSVTYGIEIARDQFLAVGFQPGLFQRKINASPLTWSSQWTGTSFDQGIVSGESLIAGNMMKFNLNTGIYYYGNVSDQLVAQGGIALHHVTGQDISFVGTEERLYRKIVVSGGVDYSISNSKLGIVPNAMFFMQGPNKEINIGSDFKYYIKESSKYTGYFDETSVSLGAYYRTGDSFNTTFYLNHAGFSLGLSYDFNMSGLSPATGGLGGMEFALRYRSSFSAAYSSFK